MREVRDAAKKLAVETFCLLLIAGIVGVGLMFVYAPVLFTAWLFGELK